MMGPGIVFCGMKHIFASLLLLVITLPALAQTATSKQTLTVETIMQDPRYWVGTSPSGVFWSDDSRTIYFNWHRPETADKALGDSLYKIVLPAGKSVSATKPVKVSIAERRLLTPADAVYNRARTLRLYDKYGDLFLLDRQTGAGYVP